MKKRLLFALLVLALLTLCGTVAAQNGDPCINGHHCNWSVYLNRQIVAHGLRVLPEEGNSICAATWLQTSMYQRTGEEIVGLEIWGGECRWGAIITIKAGPLRLYWHTGVQRLPPLKIGRRGWIGKPGSGLYYSFS